MLIPVILSGGAGSRLWPLSREHYPKQLLALTGHKTLLQATVERLHGLSDVAPPIVVCNEIHRFLVAAQLREIGVQPLRLLLEPVGRNTAPAIAVAASTALTIDPDATLLVLPADNLIQDNAAFHTAITHAATVAAQDYLATFGITPTRAETGYGYIKAGTMLPGADTYQIEQFVEKPDAATAEKYLTSGAYYWNSGMFLFRASRYLEELAQHAPAMHSACEAAFAGLNVDAENDFYRLDEAAFVSSPSDSIDYAVMEHTDAAAVTPLDAGWNDIGAWSALWDVGQRDEHQNVVFGDVVTEDVQGCYLRAEHRLLAAIGIEDLVIVETADAVMVAHRDKVQDVKNIVTQLKAEERIEANLHRKVLRPWGSYENIDAEAGFLVKRMTVNPGAGLSLQMHHHRSEHWVVVKGTARVTCKDKVFLLTENQSTYIPLGATHRLENPGKITLELIEVQSGSYLDEDDIVRFEDKYGR